MKINEIRIFVSEKKTDPARTQAMIMEYHIDSQYDRIYTLTDPAPRYSYRDGPTINIKCMCPKCASEFNMIVRDWSYDQKIQMVCTCGLPLHLLPHRPEYERTHEVPGYY